MLSGTIVGFICVGALLMAAILLAVLDRNEKSRGHLEKSHFLSRMALGFFLAAFVGGVTVTLLGGVQPRQEGQVMTGKPMSGQGGPFAGGSPEGGPMAAIGQIDEKELALLKDKVGKDPHDVRSRERLGHLYLQQQDFEKVFELARETLTLNPKSAESLAHMGMILFAMQDLDNALQQFDQALKYDPKNLETLLFKGIVQFQGKQDLAGAKATWERFMKIAKPGDTGIERVRMFLKMIDSQSKGLLHP